MPPTLIRTNSFVCGFQAIVDGYGMARYQEVNPGFFAIAMFPFLFGVMFGDMIHGFLMMLGGFLLIVQERGMTPSKYKRTSESFKGLYDARWTIFVCGLCAMYMGFIYNEGLSVAFNLFGTGYTYEHNPDFGWSTAQNMTGVNAGDNSAKIYKDCGWDADNHGIAGDWGSAG